MKPIICANQFTSIYIIFKQLNTCSPKLINDLYGDFLKYIKLKGAQSNLKHLLIFCIYLYGILFQKKIFKK